MYLPARARHLAVSILALALLSACGGGGDDPGKPNVVPPEGAYAGTLSGSADPGNTEFRLLFIGTAVWALYGAPSGNAFLVDGFIQGTGTATNGNFVSSSARDFGFSPAVVGTATATYTGAGLLSGTFKTATTTTTFSGSPIAASIYNYSTQALPATIAGTWPATGGSVTITATLGVVTGSLGGCTFHGNAMPHGFNKNYFDVALDFDNLVACQSLAGDSTTGIALAYPVGNGAQTQLLVGVTNLNRDDGVGFALVR